MSCPLCRGSGWVPIPGRNLLGACSCPDGTQRLLQGAVFAADIPPAAPSPDRPNPEVRAVAVAGWRDVCFARGIPEPDWLAAEPRPAPAPPPTPKRKRHARRLPPQWQAVLDAPIPPPCDEAPLLPALDTCCDCPACVDA